MKATLPRPVIRTLLVEGRIMWKTGKAMLVKHFTCTPPLVREMGRIADLLSERKTHQGLSPAQQENLDDILDDLAIETLLGDEVGGRD